MLNKNQIWETVTTEMGLPANYIKINPGGLSISLSIKKSTNANKKKRNCSLLKNIPNKCHRLRARSFSFKYINENNHIKKIFAPNS